MTIYPVTYLITNSKIVNYRAVIKFSNLNPILQHGVIFPWLFSA